MRQGMAGVLVMGFVLSAGAVEQARAQQVQVSPANRTIAITATENAERRADVATLHIGYHVYAADSASAYAKAAEASQAIAAALAKLGVAKDAVSSESQSTGESQEFRNSELTPEQRAQRRFEAQQTWTVKTTPDAVARVLAEAVGAGANQSGQIDWSLADDASLTAEASTKALAHAKELASQMATGLGAKVGSLLYASNEAPVRQGPRQFDRMEAMAKLQMAPQLSLGAPMITRSATVAAIFAVE